MYYVIKKQHETPLSTFISFQVPKYIASRKNESVIFEFKQDKKLVRKWVKKSDIILLTNDKDFFIKTIKQFKEVEDVQQKLVNQAQEQLNKSVETFTETMTAEIDEFNEIKSSADIPCILKDL